MRKPAARLVGLVFLIGICYLVAWTGALVSPDIAPSESFFAIGSNILCVN